MKIRLKIFIYIVFPIISCSSFPVIVDNSSNHELILEFRLKESRKEHLEFWKKNPILLTHLPQSLIKECRDRFKFPEIRKIDHNFQTKIPAHHRICISTKGSPKEVFENLTLIFNSRSKQIQSEFLYFRTSVDTIGYIYRISDDQ